MQRLCGELGLWYRLPWRKAVVAAVLVAAGCGRHSPDASTPPFVSPWDQLTASGEVAQAERAIGVSVARCMQHHGWDYGAEAPKRPVDPPRLAARWGFGFSTVEGHEEAYQAALTGGTSHNDRYKRTLDKVALQRYEVDLRGAGRQTTPGGCTARGIEDVLGSDSPLLDARIVEHFGVVLQAIDDDPRVAAAFGEPWLSCMAEAGYVVGDYAALVEGFRDEFARWRQGQRDLADLDDLQRREVHAAVASRKCISEVVDPARQLVENELFAEFRRSTGI